MKSKASKISSHSKKEKSQTEPPQTDMWELDYSKEEKSQTEPPQTDMRELD